MCRSQCKCPSFRILSDILTAPLQTEIFRKVFHAIPDDLVTTWKQYKEFIVHHERLNKPVSVQCAHVWKW